MARVGNGALQLQVRDATCDACKLGRMARSEVDVCVTGTGTYPGPDFAVVTKFPLSETGASALRAALHDAGLPVDRILWLSALKCRVWDVDPSAKDIKACKPYLQRELELARPPFVLAMGNEALSATTGKSGIMKYRSKTYSLEYGGKVLPTLALAAVERNPGQRAGFDADLKMFARMVNGEREEPRPPVIKVKTKDQLRELKRAIQSAESVSFDIETRTESVSWSEKDPSSTVVSIAVTLWGGPWLAEDEAEVWAVPLDHPESPFRRVWASLLAKIISWFRKHKRRVAHNGKYDAKWIRHHAGDSEFTYTFDTMVAAHMINENRPIGLKPLAFAELGVSDWAIDCKDLWTLSIDEVLEYNGLDTFYTYRLYLKFRAQLLKTPSSAKLFKVLQMPLMNEYIGIESHGIWCDRQLLVKNWKECKEELARLEGELESFVPPEPPYAINWNRSKFLLWFLFEYLCLPVIERGKGKDDGTPGDPAVGRPIMMQLAEQPGDGGKVASLLVERSSVYKKDTAFYDPYSAIIDDNDRIHTTFRPFTVTGRMSSGKENDNDKTIVATNQIKGANLTQVPQDPKLRGLFGAPPGYVFVGADFSQIELRAGAFVFNERTLKYMYNNGLDVHMEMAKRLTGKPESAITKHDRTGAKATNFGFLFGMYEQTFMEQAWKNYGIKFDEETAHEFRETFFNTFQDLQPAYARLKRLARKYKRVMSPLGRIRHLPDIDSPNEGVRREAERQAINSPVQGMASDMTQLSMILIQRKFRKLSLDARSVGTVHDAINFEIREDHVARALPIIKDTMENLPLGRLFGVELDLPIVADIEIGSHWGTSRELSTDEVYNYAA